MYSISVVIPTFNSSHSLTDCLNSIEKQNFPSDKIETIIVDGGSTDTTIEIANNFHATIIVAPQERDNPEKRKALGSFKARNDLVAFIDSDNVLPHNNWFNNMLEPFLQNDSIVAVSPLRYHYDKKASLLNRYFSLFGVNDPIAYYFNKRDRLSWFEFKWNMLGKAIDKGNFYEVEFKDNQIPTLGANGFLIKRNILLKALKNPNIFFHIDVNCDIIQLGYNLYGFVKDDIIHSSGSNLLSFLKKRSNYMKKYYLKNIAVRRFKMYSNRDKFKLIKYILFSVTLIIPFLDAARGYSKIRDKAWFLHPVMCLLILAIYGFAVIQMRIEKLLKLPRP